VRRKFVESEDAYPDLSRQALEWIGELYAVERKMPELAHGAEPEERERWFELRQKLRHEESHPVVLALRDWALSHRGRVLPQSNIGKAIEYMISLWPGLTLFLSNPRVPLDNNGAERALRGVVVGRKNHYGSRSKRGTEVAALFYTLLETAKLSQVDPAAYLRLAATRAIASPGTVTLPSDLT
jgi:transposase